MRGNSKRSKDEIILACKEVGCPWDPYPSTVQEQDRFGRLWWYRYIKCMNCGSVKREKYPVGDVRFATRIGQPKYFRTPGWYAPELKIYWGHAREARADSGYLPPVEGVEVEQTKKLKAVS